MSNLIWTPATSDMLFEQIVKRYGPYSDWERSNYPGRDLDQDYEEFRIAFAKVCNAKSEDAVGMAIMVAAKPKLAKDGNENILASALKYRFITVNEILSVEPVAA
jgi:hypothetical protein